MLSHLVADITSILLCFQLDSGLDVSIGGFDSGEVELKTNDTPGDLELGELTEEYFLDSDLRALLSAAPLNPDEMKPLEGQHLLLVTDVVYSSKFVLAGNRMHQVWDTVSFFNSTACTFYFGAFNSVF